MNNDNWIAKKYEGYYEKLKKHVEENSTIVSGFRYFTPHDSNHCYSVEKIVKDLVEKSEVKLNNSEKFILLSAVWTHDLGMVDAIATKYLPSANMDERREKHDETSAWYLKKHFKTIFGLIQKPETFEDKDKQSSVQRYVHMINTISKYHRRKEDVNKCQKELFVENEEVRTRLLACFLRLGDTLHVDLSRYDKEFYDILQIGNFDRVARLHWLKSYVVSNIHIDDKKETIVINMDLPEYKSTYNVDINELKEGYVKLSSILKEDIYEDILDVNETFREYNLTCYTAVKPIINLIPGYDERDSAEIFGIIDDIEIILSPNDSKVNKKAISSIKSLCKADFSEYGSTAYEAFYNYTKQLIEHLDKISDKRPCHVGLKTIVVTMKKVFDDNFTQGLKENEGDLDKIERLRSCIDQEIGGINKKRKKWEEEVYDHCEEVLKGKKYIFLCAFSEMVSNFLNEYSEINKDETFKDVVNIYILEYGGKRRFLRNNVNEYNDGTYYSIHLKKLGFKNINLMPDTSLASCINHLKEDRKINPKNSVVLLGANGIDKEGNCGHSSGYLMVAIVAKYFEIPVKVISNKFKEGEIKWNLSKLRKGNWLTGQKNRLKELDDHGIILKNYLEDKVPKTLFDLITN